MYINNSLFSPTLEIPAEFQFGLFRLRRITANPRSYS